MEKFRIYTYSNRIYYYYIDYISNTINKIDSIYRNNIDKYFLLLIENIIRANINKGNNREKYQKEILVDINMIKCNISILKDKYKLDKYLKLDNMLNELDKMIKGWINEKS